MTNDYRFGEAFEYDETRAGRNMTKVLAGECGRKKKNKKVFKADYGGVFR
jgi:hypothetical protein